MGKKDYILIAKAISGFKHSDSLRREIAECLAIALKADNATFNRDRFIDACMVNTRELPK